MGKQDWLMSSGWLTLKWQQSGFICLLINCWSPWHYFWVTCNAMSRNTWNIRVWNDCKVPVLYTSGICFSFRFLSSTCNEKAISAILYCHTFPVVGLEVRLKKQNLVPEFCSMSSWEWGQIKEVLIWNVN